MKKGSLDIISKQLKQATDVMNKNKEPLDFSEKPKSSKLRSSASNSKPVAEKMYKHKKADSLSNIQMSKMTQKKASLNQEALGRNSDKNISHSAVIPQGSNTYVSSKNKAIVNIFNFNNYNIIRNEKEKFSKETRQDFSADRSIKSNDNLQNFFIFSRANREKAKQQVNRQVPIREEQKAVVEKGMKPINLEMKSGVRWKDKSKIKHSKSGSMNLKTSQSILFGSSLLNRSYRSGASIVSMDNGSEKATESYRQPVVNEMNAFLRQVQSQNRFSHWLNAIKIAHKTKKNPVSSIHALLQRKFSLASSLSQDLLEKTKDLVSSLITELKEIPQPTTFKSQERGCIGTQADIEQPRFDEAVPISQNYISLIRETAIAFLSQSKRFKEPIADAERFFRNLTNRRWIDQQTVAVFNKSISILQEHLIFEDALRILQEKGVPLDNVFGLVYEKLGIYGAKDGEQNSADLIIEELEISGASFEESTLHSKIQADGGEVDKSRLEKSENDFKLDFKLLRNDSLEIDNKELSPNAADK